MINYSIVMRPVNANLLEINQAKARIKKANEANETPKPEDVALVASEKQNAFAIAQYSEVMTVEKFARHISDHGSVYSRADIAAILYMAVDCIREQLLEGKKIRLGDLGDFSVSLGSTGAETADRFSAQNITAVNVVWDAGKEFKSLLKDAEFNLVPTRAAQAALIKAIKAGENTVTLNEVNSGTGQENGGGTPSSGGSEQSQGGGNAGGGSTPSGGSQNPPSGGGSGVNPYE